MKSTTELSLNLHNSRQSGRDLVLLHGWGLNQAIWDPIVPSLTSHYRVWTMDLPGFGDSGWEAPDADFSHASARVANVIAAHIDHPCVLAGWSMGGLVATEIALRHPRRVHRLVTIASSPHFLKTSEWSGIDPDVLRDFRAQLGSDLNKTIDRFLSVQALGSPQARAEIKAMRTLLKSKPVPHAEALEAGLQWLAQVDLRSQLCAIDVPMTRLYGRRDSLVPATIADAISTTLSAQNDQSQVFLNSAHAPFITEPEAFVEALISANDARN
ncbi:pimeloyl-ACP methyl ester esterase BioH [Aliidiomarina halalkaliphila]|uniref:Pimeloyl-[acyl-carrier protein] methyl ester esterase n=1 Tax=Aliidiomarina halalkaliphila TaxID=2593535 RepID=A0A552X1R8_9GAMM|nr:pimeloyl-ACP methyl ester esterase BioH [Aliidiomarina halalkaliphila]TRW48990.1 pimeloyl-ACP methyl ester esterase BioH [Aliidiomarina halalkaliphila]